MDGIFLVLFPILLVLFPILLILFPALLVLFPVPLVLDIRKCHTDCGLEIYDGEKQDTHAGGSGCGCAASVFVSYVLPKIRSGEWKRVLFVPTGALLSKVTFNEGKSVPGIAHGVIVEQREEGGKS